MIRNPPFLVQCCAVVLATALGFAPIGAQSRSFYTVGAGGVPLAITDVGPEEGKEILFLHGIGQGSESFQPQIESSLAQKYHMVAFDLRGHGLSGKPWDEGAYTNPATWAEDVTRVINATKLKRPVLVGWSYGTLIIADYVRSKGIEHLSGIMLVSALGGFIDTPPPSQPMPPELVMAHELQPIPDVAAQKKAVGLVIPFLTGGPAVGAWNETALILGLMVPPYAQGPLRKHPNKNVDLSDRLKLPVMVVHGGRDAALRQDAVDHFLAESPGSKESKYEQAGHSPFAEEPVRFNRELSAFVDLVMREKRR